jgi:hypothetical protein
MMPLPLDSKFSNTGKTKINQKCYEKQNSIFCIEIKDRLYYFHFFAMLSKRRLGGQTPSLNLLSTKLIKVMMHCNHRIGVIPPSLPLFDIVK